jgi:ribosomal protein S18 acetylase RimI-like enzyme
MNIQIKKATIDDLQDIQKLNIILFKKEYEKYDKSLDLKWTFGKQGTQFFKDKLTKSENCGFIAIRNGKIIGYIVGGICKAETYRNMPKTAELDNMFVLKEFRNKGIGKKLYHDFLKWCKSKNVEIIRVQASSLNKEAINFYRKNGFKDYTLILESKIRI